MPVEVVGTPVEVTGAPVDIDANASARPPVVAGKPLTKQLTGLATSPTPESEQKGLLSLLAASAFQGIVPIIILSAYYQNEWSNAYCEETGLAEWALVFAWVGMGGVIYQLLANVWFWSINWNWKHFTTGRRRGDQADPSQEEVARYLTEHGRAGQSRLVLLRPECALAGRTRNQPSSSSSWFVQGTMS